MTFYIRFSEFGCKGTTIFLNSTQKKDKEIGYILIFFINFAENSVITMKITSK